MRHALASSVFTLVFGSAFALAFVACASGGTPTNDVPPRDAVMDTGGDTGTDVGGGDSANGCGAQSSPCCTNNSCAAGLSCVRGNCCGNVAAACAGPSDCCPGY